MRQFTKNEKYVKIHVDASKNTSKDFLSLHVNNTGNILDHLGTSFVFRRYSITKRISLGDPVPVALSLWLFPK